MNEVLRQALAANRDSVRDALLREHGAVTERLRNLRRSGDHIGSSQAAVLEDRQKDISEALATFDVLTSTKGPVK